LLKILALILLCFAKICFAGKLMVVTENFPPFNYQDEQGSIQGTASKNVKEVLALAGVDYDISLYPWARSYHLATQQEEVLIYTIFRSAYREQKFHWFCPIAKPTKVFLYKLRKNPLSITSLEQAKNYRIGVMRNDNSHQYLLRKGFTNGINLDVASNEATNWNKLFAGRIDFIAQSEHSLAFRLAQFGKRPELFAATIELHPEENNTPCMALSKASSSELVNRLQLAFDQWQASQPSSR